MILMIDNYDSFTYNIVQEFGMLGADVTARASPRCGLRRLSSRRVRGIPTRRASRLRP